MKKILILSVIIMSLFITNFASALFERTIESPDLRQSLISEGVEISESAMKYEPIEVVGFWDGVLWIEDKKADLVLTEHTESCGQDCLSEFTISTYTDSALIDDIKFYRLDEGQRQERSIRGYQFYYWGDIIDYETQCKEGETIIDENNGTSYTEQICEQVEVGSHQDWISYNLGDVLPAGTYQVKLEGQKAPYMSIDWVIQTQGKMIDEWATWGSFDYSLGSGLVAQYRLNTQNFTLNNQTFVVDSMGQNNGTLVGNKFNNGNITSVGNVTITNNVFNFNSSNGAISMPVDEPLNITTNEDSFTYSVWVYPTSIPTTGQTSNVLSFRYGTLRGSGLQIDNFSNSPRISFSIRNDSVGTSKNAILSLNTWYHITATYNSVKKNASLYSNGVYVDSFTGPSYSNQTTFFWIGASGVISGTSSNFNGSINNVLIYNRSLSSSEISQIYALGKDEYTNISDGLVAQYSGRDYAGSSDAPTTIYDTNQLVKGKINQGLGGLKAGNYFTLPSGLQTSQMYWYKPYGSSWTHYANVSGTVYTNGVATGSLPSTVTLNSTGFFANGSIDDVRIYNRSLSASEISGIYNAGIGTEDATTTTGQVSLNSPSDGSIQYTKDVTLNSSANVMNGAYLVNATLYDNSTGSWGARNSTSFNSSLLRSENLTISWVNDTTRTTKTGVKVSFNQTVYIYSITRTQPYVSATTAYIQTSYASGIIATATFNSSGVAVFSTPVQLNASTDYAFLVDSGGAGYFAMYSQNSSALNPDVNTGYTTWKQRYSETGSNDDYAESIQNIGILTAPNLASSSKNQTFSNTYPSGSNIKWNYQFCDSDGACGFAVNNYTFTVDNVAPTISIVSPPSLVSYGYNGQNTTLSYLVTDTNLDSCWYNYNGTNVTTPCTSGVLNTSYFTIANNDFNMTFYANDTAGNLNSSTFSWNYKVWDNGISYYSPVFIGSVNQIIGNYTLTETPSNITLVYNGTVYNPSISVLGNEYILTTNATAPSFSVDTNISFYYSFLVNGTTINSYLRNQTIQTAGITTNCAGNYSFINISNYDEESLVSTIGTVEYIISLYNSNLLMGTANGSFTGTNLSICSTKNLSNSTSNFNLQLRYYKNDSTTTYKTYNMQNSLISLIPMSLNLYFLNVTLGTIFNINYKDFQYQIHPNALIQIQRNYLNLNQYKIVEIPIIGNEGSAKGSFNTNNVEYKIVIVENGQIIDSFDHVYPKCQSLALGQCELDLRGNKSVSTITDGDFNYYITQGSQNITLTYVIPSGTPKSVTFVTNQSSRFINGISNCNSSQYASGGTITCNYNNTVGDSVVSVQIDVSGQDSLFGSLLVSENTNALFFLNNYFIGFILLLTIGLMFISSGVILVIVGAVGVVYLGLIFLLKGVSLGMVATSTIWLIIAVGLIVYKLSQKEEKYGN